MIIIYSSFGYPQLRKWEYIRTWSSLNPNSYANLKYNKADSKLLWLYNKSAQYCAMKLGHQSSEVTSTLVVKKKT